MGEQWPYLPSPKARKLCQGPRTHPSWPLNPFHGELSIPRLSRELGLFSYGQRMHLPRLCRRERSEHHGQCNWKLDIGCCSFPPEQMPWRHKARALLASKSREGSECWNSRDYFLSGSVKGCCDNHRLPDTLGRHWLQMPPHRAWKRWLFRGGVSPAHPQIIFLVSCHFDGGAKSWA